MSGLIGLNLLSNDARYEGFDLQAGKTWIYPTNYPLRDYQFNIIQEALVKNTLVSLPTGLGKTFIAAVVMYNFYRWYPTGKIIFMAPTRPLVKQQIDACYNIMGIPKDATAELTGSNVQGSRNDIWKEKRVFFVTAQVLSNDLDRIADLGPSIKCLIFDEAHRAKGNYAYCLVIRKLLSKTKYFRVLALSATPGNNIADVEEVVKNLLISHIELRTEESPDVVPYTFQKNMETVVVPIGEKLTEIRDRYIQVLEKYTRILLKHRVIQGNCSMLTKGKIFMTLKDFQERNRTNRCEAYSEIMRNLNICITLYHGFELLIRHGLRGFLSFFQEHAEKPLLRGNSELFDIMRDVDEYLGPPPDISPLPDGTTPEIPENTRFGHPKFYKLCDILLAHFTEHHANSSRVIVFCEYRESVMEAYALLLQQKPLIKPKVFIGQGTITQRQQLNVIQSFIQGDCNTLISTCIGEEGLDVGEVDLIVCFDISNKSPVRMIQRIGRTGRKRDGRVVILVTEGKEEQTLKACLIQKHYLSKSILSSVELAAKLYKENSRMIPDDIIPNCMKIHINVKKENKCKSETIKGMFSKMEDALTQGSTKKQRQDRIPEKTEYWDKKHPLQINDQNKGKIGFSKFLEKQRKLQATGIICHSKESDLLVSLLQIADSKRYNIPITQGPSFSSQSNQAPKEKSKVQKTDGYKQSDLRTMLFKTSSKNNIIPTQTALEENTINQKIADYLQSIARTSDACKICANFFDCNQLKPKDRSLNVNELMIPDLEVLHSINSNNLDVFMKSLNNFEEIVENNSVIFEPPKNFSDVLRKCDSTLFDNFDFTQVESGAKKSENFEEVLRFFKLSNLDDLFVSPAATLPSPDDTVIYTPESEKNDEKLSPVLSKTQICQSEDTSPILCSYERTKLLKDRAQRKLFTGENSVCDTATQVSVKPRLSNLLENKKNSFYVSKTTEKLCDTSGKIGTDILEDIDDIFDTSFLHSGKTESQSVKSAKFDLLADIGDICDLSLFEKSPQKKESKSETKCDVALDLSDICDISALISKTKTQRDISTHKKIEDDVNSLLDLDDICDLSFFKPSVSQKTENCEVNNSSSKKQLQDSKTLHHRDSKAKAIVNTQTHCQQRIQKERNVTVHSKKQSPCSKLAINKNTQDLIPQNDFDDFKEPVLNKSPKNVRLNSKRSINSLIKKYTATENSLASPSHISASQQTQLSVTQILNIINADGTKTNSVNSTRVSNKSTPVKKELDSEDEFETHSLVRNKPKYSLKTNKSKNSKAKLSFESDDDFEMPLSPKINNHRTFKKPANIQPKRKQVVNPFIELEAEVSEEEGVVVSEDESITEDNCLDSSFVNDETQDFTSTQMHAHYLQSVRSPRVGTGFKIPKLPKMNSSEIFSQPVVDTDDTYLNDTFCVDSQGLSQQDSEPCPLEIAEMILQQERKRKRQKKSEKVRKKRILKISDDSD